MMPAPEAWVSKTIIWAWRSVAKPGKGRVATSTPHPDAGRARGGVYMHAHLPQLLELHLQVLGEGVGDRDVSAGRRRGHKEGTRFDAVWHHRPPGGVKFRNAFYHDAAGAGALDARAHRVEEAGEGGDLRLSRAVLYNGDPISEHGGHHNVLRGADARILEVDLGRAQPVGHARLYKAVVEFDFGTERPQAVDVEVELPQTQVTPARRRDLGLPEARCERPEDDEAGTHLAHQLVGGRVGVHRGGVDLQGVSREVGFDPEFVEEGDHRVDVIDAGDVVENRFARCQKRRSDELQGGVFRPRDFDLPLQAFAALDVESLRHGSSPVCLCFPVRSHPDSQLSVCPPEVTKRQQSDNVCVTNGAG